MHVQALNSAGSPTSSVPLQTALTLANPPISANPTNIQTNQITANWGNNNNPPGTTYVAQISVDPGFSSGPSSSTVNTFAAFLGLLPDTTYFMRVQAVNAAGIPTLPFTLLPSAVTHENAPAAPGGAAFSNVTSTQIQTNWTTSGNPSDTLYHVILSTAPSPSTNGLINRSSTTVNTSVLFSGLFTNTLYYAEVNATTSGGTSAYTDLTSIATFANQPTSANPTNVQTNQVTANWGSNSNPLGTLYTAQIATDINFTQNVVNVSTTSLSATFTSLSANTTYFMQVLAQNLNLVPTLFTPLPSTTTLPNAPSPVGFNGISTTQLHANWTPNGNPPGTQYLAILSTGASPSTNNFGTNQSSTTVNTSAAFSNLLVNTRYFVDVAALNTISNSTFVSMGPVSTLANFPTALPSTGIQSNQITANWGTNGNPPGTSYLVQASVDPLFQTIADAVSDHRLFGDSHGTRGEYDLLHAGPRL